MPRSLPNIIITGTPGTGKTSHAELLKSHIPELVHYNIGSLVKSENLYEKYDEEWDSYIVDEDKLIDYLEPLVENGGCILDWHSCEVFPKRWIDLVAVLRTDHAILWDRLEARGYSLRKIEENNEAEIMEVVLAEARDSYDSEIIVELQSENDADFALNVDRIVEWIQNWK
ncbi:Adenylate kinase isoenzyme 6 [Neolecta irregularis DAH-3]|uniref:Adenylate kinase isoenzyme 6 homolog n=1 Tax=Neolecta irregularis (strain DAH-3) TaxID=1198029 RepID=A0A1U7LM19_NEOID|nr:Adenylate kinase isoenzyme 6 [Neolecta irregularis DAH-3]|eukprot:OLL23689.1 Adenylate kinase isoenzyme 6 [Neolecta irregularis DAH-3]